MTKIQRLYNALQEARQAYSFVCGSDTVGLAQGWRLVTFHEKEIAEFLFGTEVNFNKGPLARAAIVHAKALRAKRNATLVTIAINVTGSIIGALCVVYSVHVVLG
jgi:hypothetical protein